MSELVVRTGSTIDWQGSSSELDDRLWPIIQQLLCVEDHYGLRATKQASHEEANGIWGDALNLLPSNNFLNLCVGKLSFQDECCLPTQDKSDQNAQKIVSGWRNGVKYFIRTSIDTFKTDQFVRIKRAGQCGDYDNKDYGLGLGKMGKQEFASTAIKQLEAPSETLELDKAVMWHFSQLITALEHDLLPPISTKETLSVFSRKKSTEFPIDVKKAAIVLAVIFIATAVFLQQ